MYKLVNLDDKKHKPVNTSHDLLVLWQLLDAPEFKYKRMVIIDETGEIRAGKEHAWTASQRLKFQV